MSCTSPPGDEAESTVEADNIMGETACEPDVTLTRLVLYHAMEWFKANYVSKITSEESEVCAVESKVNDTSSEV